jgi:iron complex outermembrane recepter protein
METNLQETPIAISVFTPSLLHDRAVTSIRDPAGQAPNLFISRANISHTTQTFSLRGIGETDPIHYEDRYFTQELQVNGHFEALTFTTGVFYLNERFFVERDGYSRRNSMLTDPVLNLENYNFLRAHNVTVTDSVAAFGELNLKLASWATLTAGLRETIELKHFRFDNKTLNLQGSVTGDSIQGEAEERWSALTPKAGLAFEWLPTLLQYFTYSRGFKSGGFDNRATLLELAQRPFDPE